jgi:putative transposase
MGRIARVVAAKNPHHVTPRGNRRQDTFFCEEDELLIHRHEQTGRPLGEYSFY